LILQPATPFAGWKDVPSPDRVLAAQEAAMAVHGDVRAIPQIHRLSGQM
jgi:hypothetical protein